MCKMKQRRSTLTRPLLLMVALLVVAEVVCRWVGPPVLPPISDFIEAQEWRYTDWIEKDSTLFWRYRPSQVIDRRFMKPGRYTINSHGYRGPEFKIEKPEGVTRIVCLGESNTFGLGVADDAVWPRQLENMLNKIDPQKRRWEVLNLAVTNYSTFQGVRQAREELPRLQPDIVMSCLSWADHQPAANGVSDDQINVNANWLGPSADFLNHSAAFRWLRVAWATIAPGQPPAQAAPGFDQRRVSTTLYSENIEKITREALKVGARPITVTSPISWPPPGKSDSTGIFHVHQRYRLLSRFGVIAAKGEFIELANAFDEVPRLFDDPTKDIELFNTRGHAFAGEFLARFLLGDSTLISRFGSSQYSDPN